MGCNANILGIIDSCATSVGGVKAAVFMNAYDSYLIEPEDDGSGWSLTDAAATGGVLMPFVPSKQTSSFTSTLNVDVTNGSAYVSTEITLQFNKMDVASRIELNKVIAGRWCVFIKDANNKWYVFGYNKSNYAYASAGTGQTGGEKSDGNYYQVTITATSAKLPVPCDDATTITYLEKAINSDSPAGRTPIVTEYLADLLSTTADDNGTSTIDTGGDFLYLVGSDIRLASGNKVHIGVRSSAVAVDSGWDTSNVVSYTLCVINGDTPTEVTEGNADIKYECDKVTDTAYAAHRVWGRTASGDWTLIAYMPSGGGTISLCYAPNRWKNVNQWSNGAHGDVFSIYAPKGSVAANNTYASAYLG